MFIYNNTKNIKIYHILSKFNYDYNSKILFEDEIDPYLRSCSTNKLAKELKKLKEICYQNLFYI